MKFVRYGAPGAEKPGVIDADGQLRDLSGQVSDLSGDVLTRLETLTADGPVVPGNPRLGPPVGGTRKMVCIGRNYADHAAETGSELPPEPLIFMKATSAMQGPNDPVVIPRDATKVDWEVELGVVIGLPARYVSEADALSHVAGYCIVNDVTERHWQKHRAGQWTKGKSPDTFGPTGPWLVTPDLVGDPQALDLSLWVNGDIRQQDNTAQMIFGVAHLISYLSGFFTLESGDIIATGTPAGVGAGMSPQQFLKAGDHMRLTVAGLGEQQIPVIKDEGY